MSCFGSSYDFGLVSGGFRDPKAELLDGGENEAGRLAPIQVKRIFYAI